MEELLTRAYQQLVGRDHGPLTFRLIAQPLIAILFAVRAGMRDAREGRPIFFWTAAFDHSQRAALIREGWKDIGKLFVVASVLDVIYQLVVFRWVYPVQVLIVATILTILPYLALRGVSNRIGRAFLKFNRARATSIK